MNNLEYNQLKLYNKTIILNLYKYIQDYSFIIFINIYRLKNDNLIYLKNEVSKLNCKNLVINTIFIKKIFHYTNFKFFGTNTLLIFLKDINNFIFFINLLEDTTLFYYSYNKIFGNITQKNIIFKFYEQSKNSIIFLHYIIFKILYKIVILLLLLIISLVKFIDKIDKRC